MQNFNDVLNGVTDGSKDLSISALTVAGNASFNGNVTLGNASGDVITITGTPVAFPLTGYTDGSSAVSGVVGEFKESVVTSFQTATTSGQWADATSLSLTAGDWNVFFTSTWDNNSGSFSLGPLIGIGATSGNNAPDQGIGFIGIQTGAGGGDNYGSATAFARISISSTLPYYAKVKATYTGSPTYKYHMFARRVR